MLEEKQLGTYKIVRVLPPAVLELADFQSEKI